MTNQERISQHKRLHNRFSKQFRPVIKNALKGQYGSYVTALKSQGAQYVLSHLIAHLIDPALTSAVSQLYKTAGIAKAELTYRELQRLPRVAKKSGTLGFNAQWTNDIIAYFRLHLFDKVVLPISETTKDYIERVLQQGITEGWGIDRMVQEIERVDYLNGRVERILRTEINRAVNYGNELAADSFGYLTMKRWISVHDNRTRHAHLTADGQTVEVDKYFTVGGEALDFPGDPKGSADNTVNCRCVTSIEAIRDTRGRLVPKDREQVPKVRGRLRAGIQSAIDELLR